MAIALGWAPTVSVEVSVQFTAGVWTEVTSYVRSLSCEIPRPSPSILGVWPVGSATIELDNRDGRFAPVKTTSPYYPNVLQGRHVRFRATHGVFTNHAVWYGVIDDWGDSYPQAKDGIATISAVQSTATLAGKSIAPGGTVYAAGETTQARLASLRAVSGWSFGATDDTGTATMAATTHEGDTMSSIASCVAVEGGVMYCHPDGRMVTHNRHVLITRLGSVNVQAVFGDGGGIEVPCHTEPPLSSGRDLVANEVIRGNVGRPAFTASATATLGQAYSDIDTRLIGDDDTQANSLASGVLLLRGTQQQHPTSVAFQPHGCSGSVGWNQALGRLPLDRVRVRMTLPWAPTADTDFLAWIVGIRHQITPGQWWTTFDLMPATNLDGQPWLVVGTAVVGSVHRIAW